MRSLSASLGCNVNNINKDACSLVVRPPQKWHTGPSALHATGFTMIEADQPSNVLHSVGCTRRPTWPVRGTCQSFHAQRRTQQETTVRKEHALKFPVSVCGNWSLKNHNLHVLQQHPTMMRTSQALPHAKQHVRQHYTSPWNIPTCRKSTGWLLCCTHAASKRLEHLRYIICVCGSANHLCDPLLWAILQFHTQVTNSRTRSVRWRKAYGIASSLQPRKTACKW